MDNLSNKENNDSLNRQSNNMDDVPLVFRLCSKYIIYKVQKDLAGTDNHAQEKVCSVAVLLGVTWNAYRCMYDMCKQGRA